MAKKKAEKIKGGLASGKSPKDFNRKALTAGAKVEMEHTVDKKIAKEIAMDHLTEHKDYYNKLKTAEKKMKKTVVDIAPDGKQDLVPGNEPLKKEPKDKKKLKDRWNELKKALDNKKAFMDLREESKPDEAEEQPQQDPQVSNSTGGKNENQSPDQGQGGEDQEQLKQEQPQQDSQVAENQSPANENESPDQEQPVDPQELIEALQQEGYSEPEIAYIVHGHHSPTIDETSRAKAQATSAMANVDVDNAKQDAEMQRMIAQRKADQEHEHTSKLSDHEVEHRKRMLDLEYENAKAQSPDSSIDKETNKQLKQLEIEKKKLELKAKEQEIQLEMEFRRKEHELKLKQMEAQMKQSSQMKDQLSQEKHKHKLTEAKKPPVKAPMKKSEDLEEELEKTDPPTSWKQIKPGVYSHPVHGTMQMTQDATGINVRHIGRSGSATNFGDWSNDAPSKAAATEMMHRRMHQLHDEGET